MVKGSKNIYIEIRYEESFIVSIKTNDSQHYVDESGYSKYELAEEAGIINAIDILKARENIK